MRGPSPRMQGGQGSRMTNNIVVSQQRQQNQTMQQPQTPAQQLIYVAQPFLPHLSKFPGTHFSAHTVSYPKMKIN